MQMTSLVDFLSGYDQVGLAKECRDMTAFMTPIGLLRQTTLPQGATNSVAQVVRVVAKILEDPILKDLILEDLIPDVCRPFVDDISVKGPKADYG